MTVGAPKIFSSCSIEPGCVSKKSSDRVEGQSQDIGVIYSIYSLGGAKLYFCTTERVFLLAGCGILYID